VDEELLAGLRMEDTERTYAHVSEQLGKRRKSEQRQYVDRILDLTISERTSAGK
jgi:hypothetical protein